MKNKPLIYRVSKDEVAVRVRHMSVMEVRRCMSREERRNAVDLALKM
jgi:hypothetical protein